MAFEWKRCTALVAAGISAALLSACGSSSVESAISPQRIVAFGDGNADVGQTGSRYTVNVDDITANWTEQVALGYGKEIKPAITGGFSYAQGNTRVTLQPDAAGNSSTPTLTKQLDNFLASSQFTSDDIVLISAGISDVLALTQSVINGDITSDEALANARTAGEALSTEVQRMIDAGAKYIAVTGTYNLGRSPWGVASNQASLMDDLVRRFNEGFKIAAVDKATNVLYIDFELYVNYFYSSPGSYSFSNSTEPVCNSIDAGNGIGTGVGQVNSALCNSNTLVNSSYDSYLFADQVYLTPSAHRQFGSWAYDQIRERW